MDKPDLNVTEKRDEAISDAIFRLIAALPERGITLFNANELLEPILFRSLSLDALGRGVALRDLETITGIEVTFLKEALDELSRRLPRELTALLHTLPPEGFKASLEELHQHVLNYRTEKLMGVLSPLSSYTALVQPYASELLLLGYSVFFDGDHVELKDELCAQNPMKSWPKPPAMVP